MCAILPAEAGCETCDKVARCLITHMTSVCQVHRKSQNNLDNGNVISNIDFSIFYVFYNAFFSHFLFLMFDN